MQEDWDTDSDGFEPEEIVTSSHQEEFHQSSPRWKDIPELNEAVRREVREIVVDVIPGILDNAARKRFAVITTIGCQYVRYRKSGCTPSLSQRQAIKRTAHIHDIGESAVYEHIRALPIEDSTGIIPLLEQISKRYHQNQSEKVRVVKELCDRLTRVLWRIAKITETPSLKPSDITLQEVYRDQPGECSRVLTTDYDVIGLPTSDREGSGASVQ